VVNRSKFIKLLNKRLCYCDYSWPTLKHRISLYITHWLRTARRQRHVTRYIHPE